MSNEPQNTLMYNQIIVRMMMVAGICFFAGFLVSLVWAYSGGYPSLPLQGETQIKATGEPTFVPYYRLFYRYAIKDSWGDTPEESLLDHIGPVGNGVFFYTTVNAPHWILELNMNNLRGMIGIPVVILFAGLYMFLNFMLPKHQQTPEAVFNYSIVICLFHAVLVVAAVVFGNVVSSSYRGLYENFNFYGGQFIGVLIPGTAIILLYALFWGAIIGSVYASIQQVKTTIATPESNQRKEWQNS